MRQRWIPLVALAFLAGPALAQEFRVLKPVPTPLPQAAGSAAFLPIDRRLIEQSVRELFAAWTTPRLAQLLGEDFYEGSRLTDTLALRIPRDTSLRVLGIEGISTLAQTTRPGAPGEPDWLVSTVAVIVRTQLEFNDP